MPNDDETPPPPFPQTPLTVSDDLTSQSLSNLARTGLSPNHPAAQLGAMNDTMHALMCSEGDQTRLLMRQAQTLDALFHFFIKHGIRAEDINLSNMVMALKSQSLTTEAVKSVHSIEYLQTLVEYIKQKPNAISSQYPFNTAESCLYDSTSEENNAQYTRPSHACMTEATAEPKATRIKSDSVGSFSASPMPPSGKPDSASSV